MHVYLKRIYGTPMTWKNGCDKSDLHWPGWVRRRREDKGHNIHTDGPLDIECKLTVYHLINAFDYLFLWAGEVGAFPGFFFDGVFIHRWNIQISPRSVCHSRNFCVRLKWDLNASTKLLTSRHTGKATQHMHWPKKKTEKKWETLNDETAAPAKLYENRVVDYKFVPIGCDRNLHVYWHQGIPFVLSDWRRGQRDFILFLFCFFEHESFKLSEVVYSWNWFSRRALRYAAAYWINSKLHSNDLFLFRLYGAMERIVNTFIDMDWGEKNLDS